MSKEPIFKSIFGVDWDKLPPVMQKHYANRPYSSDVTTVEGILDVMCAGPVKVFAWFFWLIRGIPPHNEKKVPVTVRFESDMDSCFFHFNRAFYFKSRNPYHFRSRMFQVKGSEMIEVMRYRFGWRMNYLWEGDRVKLKHKGYVLYVFGWFIPLPLTFLLGKGYAEECAIDDDSFDMSVTITHPWWGAVYEYKGRFKVKECP
jgi:hypothetical protein